MSVTSARVPGAVVSGVICLLLGVAGGVVIASFTEFNLNKQAVANPGEGAAVNDAGKGGGPPGMGGMGGGKGGGRGGGKAGGKGGFGAPNPKAQLGQLVAKLDTLTKKPLAVELTPEQKKQAKEILAGIEAKDELTDDEAKDRLDAILKVVEGQRETLEAAGYRWPGQGGGGRPGGGPPPPNPPPNPFKQGEPNQRLKSLEATLAK
jgi:hypothetical protein